MNKLIRGARWSVRASREQQRRAIRSGTVSPTDVRVQHSVWSRAAELLHQNDPDGSKLAQVLLSETEPTSSGDSFVGIDPHRVPDDLAHETIGPNDPLAVPSSLARQVIG